MLVGDLQVLRVLNLSRCSGLVGLSVLVGKIKVLRVLNLSRCPGLTGLLVWVGGLKGHWRRSSAKGLSRPFKCRTAMQ